MDKEKLNIFRSAVNRAEQLVREIEKLQKHKTHSDWDQLETLLRIDIWNFGYTLSLNKKEQELSRLLGEKQDEPGGEHKGEQGGGGSIPADRRGTT